MLGFRLYLLQRITAILIAPLVLVHLGVMIYAIQGGLSAEEILGRTRGSLVWGLNYGLFVLAVSIHAAIGLRVVISEALGQSKIGQNKIGLNKKWLDFITLALGLTLLSLGSRAVYAVVWS